MIGFIWIGLGLGLFATAGLSTGVSNVGEEKVGRGRGIIKMRARSGGGFGMAVVRSVY